MKVLVVDDNSEELASLIRALKVGFPESFIEGVSSIEAAEPKVKLDRPHVVVLDLCLDPSRGVEGGFEAIHRLRWLDSSLRIIMLTGHGDFEYGVRALNQGAANFLQKPADIPHLSALIKDGFMQATMRRSLSELKDQLQKGALQQVAGGSPAATMLREALKEAGDHRLPILSVGETGSGKGECAAIIHTLNAVSGRFVRYQPNFGSVDLVSSEIFGHLKGAFTGASNTRSGLIAQADNGTLFLDEVDEIPTQIQVMFLNAIQERKYRKVGSDQDESSNFRLISAMNCDINEALSQGKLRRDFFHRIGQQIIEVPALRYRKEDILAITQVVLDRFQVREQLNVFSVGAGAEQVLLSHLWPGNIRELQAVVETACYRAARAGRYWLSAEDVKIVEWGNQKAMGDGSFSSQVERFKVDLLERKLLEYGGNRLRAARALNLDRTTMRRILSRNAKKSS